MSDSVSAVTPTTPADTTDADNAALGQAFQEAIVKGGLMMMQSLQSDSSEAFNDNSSNPDAPF